MINIKKAYPAALALTVMSFVLASGCAAPKVTSGADLQDLRSEPKLKPGFMVDVTVMVGGTKEIEELGKRVTAQGMLAMPLLGEVEAVPLTLKQLEELLEKMYTEYFVKPRVSVAFARDIEENGVSPWGSVTVMGRVVKPGKVNIPPTRDLTVSRAIQQAGGFSTSANQSAIKITRPLGDGTTETLKVNLKSLGAGKLDEDVLLYPGDVVLVPERIL